MLNVKENNKISLGIIKNVELTLVNMFKLLLFGGVTDRSVSIFLQINPLFTLFRVFKITLVLQTSSLTLRHFLS